VGPIDLLTHILIDDKLAWSGAQALETDININKPSLFGGQQKEGGAVGNVHFFPGNDTQVMPEWLAARFGLTTATCPAFRNMASAFFTGAAGTGGFGSNAGFRWKTNTPYLPPVAFRYRRDSHVLDSSLKRIGPDSNPAHMIYEILTNEDWGMGATGTIDTEGFRAVSQVLFNENFGLSVQWSRQTTIEAFTNEILGHIQGMLFLNPYNGLQTLKLIRNDYDLSTARVLDQNNCKITNFQRKLWGETVNEIIVSYTNPANGQGVTFSAMNDANIAIQGGAVSDSRNYYMIQNATLAATVAARELRTASAPLATFQIEADRSAWNFLPGDVVKINYPEHGMSGVAVRLMKVNYGKPGDERIKIDAIEDVFALNAGAYTVPPDTGWQDTSEEPEPLDYTRPFTIPYFLVTPLMDADAPTNPTYPEVALGLLAATNSQDTFAYDLYGENVLANGDIVWESLGIKRPLGRSTLVIPLVAEAVSIVADWTTGTSGPGPTLAGFAFIGDTVDSGMELVLLYAFAGGNWTLHRGVLDTVPRAWPAGTPIWFFDADSNLYDPRLQSDGVTVNYKLLSQTSLGTLDIDDAPLVTTVATARPWLPNRPANVQVDGVGFGSLDLTGAPPPPAGSPLGLLLVLTTEETLEITWANRNRLTEDSQVLAWTDGSLTPEVGQTTTVTLMKSDRTVLATVDGLTGTSYAMPITPLAGETGGIVRVTSKRDGFESLQGHEITIINI
jgi:hypothetical protein